MRHDTTAGILLACILVGCASTIDRGRMRDQLSASGPVFTARTVEEVEALKPQLEIPFRLAVAPPLWRDSRNWSSAERAEIVSWGEELVAAGLVSECVIVPAATWDLDANTQAPGWLERLRVAAARHQADAVLLIRDVDEQSTWSNPLSILYLTIVGMWIVPGSHHEAVSMMEGLLIDNRNEYLYCSGQGEGSRRDTLPVLYLREGQARDEARVEALRNMKASLMVHAHRSLAAGR